jgi:transcriptional regulator with XRE-family HTH domain
MLIELGQELARAREKNGLSLEAAAGPAGISGAYLFKLERGVVNSPSPRVLARIAVALDVSYLRLMKLAGYLDETHLAEAQKRQVAPKPHPLAGQQLTPDEWKAVGDFIKKLLMDRKGKAVRRGGTP